MNRTFYEFIFLDNGETLNILILKNHKKLVLNFTHGGFKKKMPVYEYQCEDCGSIEEALQKFSDKPLEKCSGCSGRLNKLVSHSSFHLKGSGWYVTDYAQNSNKDSIKESKKVSASGPENQKPKKKEASASSSEKSSKKSDGKKAS